MLSRLLKFFNFHSSENVDIDNFANVLTAFMEKISELLLYISVYIVP